MSDDEERREGKTELARRRPFVWLLAVVAVVVAGGIVAGGLYAAGFFGDKGEPTAAALFPDATPTPLVPASIPPTPPLTTPTSLPRTTALDSPSPTSPPLPPKLSPAPSDGFPAIDFDPAVHVQVSSGGAFITWVSAQEEDGLVEWALTADDLAKRSGSFDKTGDKRGALAGRLNKRTHRVVVGNLVGTPKIHYQIVSGGKRDPNGPYEVSIPTGALITLPNVITGKVFYEDGSVGKECLVYVRVTQRNEVVGRVLLENTLWGNEMTEGGAYVTDITNVRQDPQNKVNNDYDKALPYNANGNDATITVEARCGPGLGGGISVTTADAEKSGFGYVNMDVTVSGTAAGR